MQTSVAKRGVGGVGTHTRSSTEFNVWLAKNKQLRLSHPADHS